MSEWCSKAIFLATSFAAVSGCTSGGPPNILLISFDTVRADRLSVYGHKHDTTPNLERLAASGVVFEQAFSQGNESAYSHASIFTGLYASEVAAPIYNTYGVPESATLVPEVLKLYGYKTAAFVAGGHVSEGFGFNQGYDTFHSEVGFASFYDTGPDAEEWLQEQDGAAPWFMFLHSYDAHRPYQKPGPWNHMYANGEGSRVAEQIASVSNLSELVVDGEYFPDMEPQYFRHPSGEMIMSTDTYEVTAQRMRDTDGMKVTDADREHVQAHYDGSIRYADLLLGEFLARAEDEGQLENTVIILLSDHGEDLLDHGYMNHRTGLYDTCIRVPTIVSGPGFTQNTRASTPVDALDIAPTILAIAGATPPAGLRGRDLRAVATGTAPALEYTFSEGVMDMVSVRTPNFKLVYHHAPLQAAGYADTLASAALTAEHFTLFDVVNDPGEKTDLIEKRLEEAEKLREALVTWRRGLVSGTHTLSQDAIDPNVADQMRKHGYWEATANETAP